MKQLYCAGCRNGKKTTISGDGHRYDVLLSLKSKACNDLGLLRTVILRLNTPYPYFCAPPAHQQPGLWGAC